MSAEVKRKKGESFEAMFRRFTKRVQQSGKVLEVKKKQYFESPKSRNLRKESALHRGRLRDKREYLLKTGQLKEEDLKPRRRR